MKFSKTEAWSQKIKENQQPAYSRTSELLHAVSKFFKGPSSLVCLIRSADDGCTVTATVASSDAMLPSLTMITKDTCLEKVS